MAKKHKFVITEKLQKHFCLKKVVDKMLVKLTVGKRRMQTPRRTLRQKKQRERNKRKGESYSRV
jgi:hypothetical protein